MNAASRLPASRKRIRRASEKENWDAPDAAAAAEKLAAEAAVPCPKKAVLLSRALR